MQYRTLSADEVGWLTRDEMVEVDRIMVEELRIELVMMMENAGRSLAQLVLDLAQPATALIYAGSGGNGGGGLVAARHLANAGVEVGIVLGGHARDLSGVPAHQFDIVERMGLPMGEPGTAADVAVDALIGYSLRGEPSGHTAELIAGLHKGAGTVVALDTPSGVDVTSGAAAGSYVQADATLTLALPKTGLRDLPAAGELYLADISVPPQVYRRLGAAPPDFAGESVVAIGR